VNHPALYSYFNGRLFQGVVCTVYRMMLFEAIKYKGVSLIAGGTKEEGDKRLPSSRSNLLSLRFL
jgi:hypothetical protein